MKLKSDYFLILSIISYLISLYLNPFCTGEICKGEWGGFFRLVMGSFGFITGGAALTWFANPILFGSWIIYFKFKKVSIILSLIATIIGLFFLSFDKIMINEGGGYGPITKIQVGYWVWISSMFLVALGNVITLLFNKKPASDFV